MFDYDDVKKLKDLYSKFDDFDRKWLNIKGGFRLLNKAGIIDDEDFQEVSEGYDLVLKPYNDIKEKATNYAVDRTMRFLWDFNLIERPDDDE